jgi:hypothetical protein
VGQAKATHFVEEKPVVEGKPETFVEGLQWEQLVEKQLEHLVEGPKEQLVDRYLVQIAAVHSPTTVHSSPRKDNLKTKIH